jgi:hypothetical protein
MSLNDIYRFTLNNGQVIGVQEWDDGRWEQEGIDRDESYSLSGTDIIKTEWDDGRQEITTYRDSNNDGTYQKVSETYGSSQGDGGSKNSNTDSQDTDTVPSTTDNLLLTHNNARDLSENIALLYEAALDRMPDISGLNYWIDRAETGVSIVQIANSFINSNEFQEKYDASTDEAFLSQLYANVLDRAPDASGQDYWLGKMNQGMSQAEVLNSFAVSEENQSNSDWLSSMQETDIGWIL